MLVIIHDSHIHKLFDLGISFVLTVLSSFNQNPFVSVVVEWIQESLGALLKCDYEL